MSRLAFDTALLAAFRAVSHEHERGWRDPFDYVAWFRDAPMPEVSLRRFETDVRDAAALRASELSCSDDDAVAWVLDVFTRERIHNASRHLVSDALDAKLLDDYLRYAFEFGREQLESCETPEELVDGVSGMLDGLHGYLITHGLVDDRYLVSERVSARSVSESNPARAEAPEATTWIGATQRELALAA